MYNNLRNILILFMCIKGVFVYSQKNDTLPLQNTYILKSSSISDTLLLSVSESFDKTSPMSFDSVDSLSDGFIVFPLGLKKGKWAAKDQNNITRIVVNYKKGRLNGNFVIYYDNNTPFIEGKYKNGVLIGRHVEYRYNGTIVLEQFYSKAGKLIHSKTKIYDSEGNVLNENPYELE